MDESPRTVWIVRARTDLANEAVTLSRRVERLRQRGFRPMVLDLGAEQFAPGWISAPALAYPWLRPFALRWMDRRNPVERPALLHVLGSAAAEVGLSLAETWRIPYVLSLDNFVSRHTTLRLSRPRCRALVVSGTDLAHDLIRAMGVPPGLIEVVPPGIELPAERCVPPYQGDRIPVVGGAGSLKDRAGCGVFLDAACRLVESGVAVEFVIAGGGSEVVDLRRQAEHLGIADRVTFAGPAGPESPFWQVVDIFCRPSTVQDTGRQLGQAMAAGLPVVSSDVPGLRGWLAHGRNGLIVRAGDPVPLAEAVRTLLADPAYAQRLGRAAREAIARRFDPEREAADLGAIYDRILTHPLPRPRAEHGPRVAV